MAVRNLHDTCNVLTVCIEYRPRITGLHLFQQYKFGHHISSISSLLGWRKRLWHFELSYLKFFRMCISRTSYKELKLICFKMCINFVYIGYLIKIKIQFGRLHHVNQWRSSAFSKFNEIKYKIK